MPPTSGHGETPNPSILTATEASPGAPAANRVRGWIVRHRAGLLAALLFVATLIVCSASNRFPYYYEKDAPSKVAQVLSGERNYYHPLLMLNAADVAMRVLHVRRAEQPAVMVGRWLMVFSCALSVAAFSLLGARLAGMAGAFGGALFVGLHPLVFELAHHFKEDPVLLAGTALSLLAMQAWWDAPSRLRAVLLGLACAVALSGKYVGIAAALLALVPLSIATLPPGLRRRDAWALFGVALLVATAIFNYQMVLHPGAFDAGFGSEITRLTRPEKVARLPQTAKLLRTCGVLFPVPILLCALYQLAYMLVHRERRWLIAWLGLAYVLIFLAVLDFTPRLFTRHFLPLTAIVLFLAGLGIAHFAQWLARVIPGLSVLRDGAWIAAALAVATYLGSLHSELRDSAKRFRHPTRERLLATITATLPPDAVIAADAHAFLLNLDGSPRADFPLPQRVIARHRLREFGGLREMVRLGATHIVAHGLASPEYFRKPAAKSDTADDEDASFEDRGRPTHGFDASEVLRSAKLLEHLTVHGNSYLCPSLKLFEIPPETLRRERAAIAGEDHPADR